VEAFLATEEVDAAAVWVTLTVRVELPEVMTDWTTLTAAEEEEGAAVVPLPLLADPEAEPEALLAAEDPEAEEEAAAEVAMGSAA
jgi:hypothetical protein